jgi:DNA-binding MarR family transcriptional regulator
MSIGIDTLPGGITGRIMDAVKSGGWWTPFEIARKTGEKYGDTSKAIDMLMQAGAFERRHLGSDKTGDLYAYRLPAGE